MGNIAKTVDEQISLLQSRGMIIDNIEKAKEVLLDVGYTDWDFIGSHLRNHSLRNIIEYISLKKKLILMMRLNFIISILI